MHSVAIMSSYIYFPSISEHALLFKISRHDRCVNIESTVMFMMNCGFIVLPDFNIGLNLRHVIYYYIKHRKYMHVCLLSPYPRWEGEKVCENECVE